MMICEYCNQEINDEDRHEDACQGSIYNGVKLCNECLSDWQTDEGCDCDDCTPTHATWSNAKSKGGLPPAILSIEIDDEEYIYQEFKRA